MAGSPRSSSPPSRYVEPESPAASPAPRSFAERQRRADAATGLVGDELETFHRAFFRELESFGPLATSVDIQDSSAEIEARFATVAEELLGPERGSAYIDALFDEPMTEAVRRRKAELGRRYMEEIAAGADPEQAARASGIIVDEPELLPER